VPFLVCPSTRTLPRRPLCGLATLHELPGNRAVTTVGATVRCQNALRRARCRDSRSSCDSVPNIVDHFRWRHHLQAAQRWQIASNSALEHQHPGTRTYRWRWRECKWRRVGAKAKRIAGAKRGVARSRLAEGVFCLATQNSGVRPKFNACKILEIIRYQPNECQIHNNMPEICKIGCYKLTFIV
jgi:hypothetical protein